MHRNSSVNNRAHNRYHCIVYTARRINNKGGKKDNKPWWALSLRERQIMRYVYKRGFLLFLITFSRCFLRCTNLYEHLKRSIIIKMYVYFQKHLSNIDKTKQITKNIYIYILNLIRLLQSVCRVTFKNVTFVMISNCFCANIKKKYF